jgi:macrolide transport system ATP-binding/permease protein
MQWLKSLFARRRRYDDLSVSIQEHLDEKIDELMDGGMSREEAARAARRAFGNVALIEERGREAWQWPTFESIWADIRFALRQLWRAPGFTLTAILTLSLGMAATLAIFQFIDSALIRPLPYAEPSRLVQVFESIRQEHRMVFSHDNYLDVQRSNRVFSSMAAWDVRRSFVLQDASGAQQVNGVGVTGGFFRTLGITPALGRDFNGTAANEGLSAASAEVILSYTAWQKHFAGRSDVLGKAITLNKKPYTVIGVLPRSFQFAPTGATAFWTTLHPYAVDPCESQRGCHVMGVVARLKNGVTLQQALDNTRTIAGQLGKRYPGADLDEDANIAPLSQVILGDIQPILLTLLAGAGLLILIAYINVASLLLVRSESRRREFAVRGALGAGRGRLVRQFITEAFVMVAASSGLGLLATSESSHLLLKLIPVDLLNSMPYLSGAGWSGHVAIFATALVMIACTLFAAAPVLCLPLSDLRKGLTAGDRGAAGTTWRLLGSRLVILELATTMVLLAGAGLLGKSFYKLLHVDIGFVPSHLATLRISAPADSYTKDEQAITLQREVVSQLKSLPGVIAAGTADGLPVGWITGISVKVEGELNSNVVHDVKQRQVSDGYFSVLETQLLKGRYFREADSATAPDVAIINATLARQYFPGEDPVGRQLFFSGQPQHSMQIVGVIADVKEGALDEKSIPVFYRPFQQSPFRSFGIVVRTSQEASSVLPSMIAAIHKIDPEIAVSDAGTMPQTIGDSSAAYLHRASAWLAGGFAALALVLSVVGLYGVISYSVSQRTREIGVRIALGAQRSSVYQLILKEAGWLTIIGIMIGLSGSMATGMLMRSLLFDVQSWDASILGAVAAVLIIFALLASYIPARRAASIDPMQALRSE